MFAAALVPIVNLDIVGIMSSQISQAISIVLIEINPAMFYYFVAESPFLCRITHLFALINLLLLL